MYSKIVVLVALAALAGAQHGGQYGHEAHHEEQYAPAHYEFKYGVEDPHTGDKKSHMESRDGDITKGEYSLVEADGTIRTVKYTVEKDSGFNAEVIRSGQPKQAAPAHYAPVSIAHAPVAVHHAPLAVHHVPVAVHHAPVVSSLGHGHATSYSSIGQHVKHTQQGHY